MGLRPKPRDIYRRDASDRGKGLGQHCRPRSRHGHRHPRLYREKIITEIE